LGALKIRVFVGDSVRRERREREEEREKGREREREMSIALRVDEHLEEINRLEKRIAALHAEAAKLQRKADVDVSERDDEFRDRRERIFDRFQETCGVGEEEAAIPELTWETDSDDEVEEQKRSTPPSSPPRPASPLGEAADSYSNPFSTEKESANDELNDREESRKKNLVPDSYANPFGEVDRGVGIKETPSLENAYSNPFGTDNDAKESEEEDGSRKDHLPPPSLRQGYANPFAIDDSEELEGGGPEEEGKVPRPTGSEDEEDCDVPAFAQTPTSIPRDDDEAVKSSKTKKKKKKESSGKERKKQKRGKIEEKELEEEGGSSGYSIPSHGLSSAPASSKECTGSSSDSSLSSCSEGESSSSLHRRSDKGERKKRVEKEGGTFDSISKDNWTLRFQRATERLQELEREKDTMETDTYIQQNLQCNLEFIYLSQVCVHWLFVIGLWMGMIKLWYKLTNHFFSNQGFCSRSKDIWKDYHFRGLHDEKDYSTRGCGRKSRRREVYRQQHSLQICS
jgi:hypothetical protein